MANTLVVLLPKELKGARFKKLTLGGINVSAEEVSLGDDDTIRIELNPRLWQRYAYVHVEFQTEGEVVKLDRYFKYDEGSGVWLKKP